MSHNIFIHKVLQCKAFIWNYYYYLKMACINYFKLYYQQMNTEFNWKFLTQNTNIIKITLEDEILLRVSIEFIVISEFCGFHKHLATRMTSLRIRAQQHVQDEQMTCKTHARAPLNNAQMRANMSLDNGYMPIGQLYKRHIECYFVYNKTFLLTSLL